jgi:membrane fusion protein, heavy metal efflux system
MNKNMMRRICSVAAFTTLVVALTGCENSEAPKASVGAPESDSGQVVIASNSPKLAHIRAEAVANAMVPVGGVSAPGNVEANANRLSHVTLPVTGRVSGVLVKIGDYVRQGQALLQVESADAEAAVSAFQQSQAAVTQAKSALAKSQMDLDRSKDLFDHGAVPQKEVFNAQAVTVQEQAAVEQAQAAVEQARRRLQLLGIGSESFGQRVTIHAPLSGKILEMSVVNGEFRNDLSAPVMTIADLSTVWITSDVPETSIRLVRTGESVKIELAAYPGETFRGRVAQIGDTVDPQTRTVKVRAELQNPNGRFKPEMFGNIQLAEQAEMRPTVPAGAVIATDGKTLVWRETAKGVFEKVTVVAGPQVGDRVAILTGLQPNDHVVVDGVMLLATK